MRRLLLATVLTAAGLTAGAKSLPTAAEAFVSAPRDVLILVDSLTRLDMIDYFNSGSLTPSSNKLEGNSRVTALSPETLTYRTSDAAEHTIAMLEGKRRDYIMLISTMFLPAADSELRFFTPDWTEIDPQTLTSIFNYPTLKDWIKPEYKKFMPDIENVIPFVSAAYTYDPATETMTVTNSLETLLSDEDYKMVKDKLYPSIVYRRNNKGKFVRIQN